jgi:hypothetical protein
MGRKHSYAFHGCIRLDQEDRMYVRADDVHPECLTATCVLYENSKSTSPIDSAQPTMAH